MSRRAFVPTIFVAVTVNELEAGSCPDLEIGVGVAPGVGVVPGTGVVPGAGVVPGVGVGVLGKQIGQIGQQACALAGVCWPVELAKTGIVQIALQRMKAVSRAANNFLLFNLC